MKLFYLFIFLTALTKFYPKKSQIKQKILLNRGQDESEEQEEEMEEYIEQVRNTLKEDPFYFIFFLKLIKKKNIRLKKIL